MEGGVVCLQQLRFLVCGVYPSTLLAQIAGLGLTTEPNVGEAQAFVADSPSISMGRGLGTMYFPEEVIVGRDQSRVAFMRALI